MKLKISIVLLAMETPSNIEGTMKIWILSQRKQSLMLLVIKGFWQHHQDYYLHQTKKLEFHQELGSIRLDITDIIKVCTIDR